MYLLLATVAQLYRLCLKYCCHRCTDVMLFIEVYIIKVFLFFMLSTRGSLCGRALGPAGRNTCCLKKKKIQIPDFFYVKLLAFVRLKTVEL